MLSARTSCEPIDSVLVARKQLFGRLIDVELSIRRILRGFGLKIGVVTRRGFEGRIRELVTGHITLERIAGAMLSAAPHVRPLRWNTKSCTRLCSPSFVKTQSAAGR